MRKRKTFIAMGIFIAMLVLGVGYAAVNNLELKLNGTANVTANAEFRVEFDTNHEVVLTPVAGTTVKNPSGDDVDVVSGSYTNGSTAIMTVNLDANTRTASAVYKIVNYSPDLKANLTAEVTADFNDSDDYLTVTKELYKDDKDSKNKYKNYIFCIIFYSPAIKTQLYLRANHK